MFVRFFSSIFCFWNEMSKNLFKLMTFNGYFIEKRERHFFTIEFPLFIFRVDLFKEGCWKYQQKKVRIYFFFILYFCMLNSVSMLKRQSAQKKKTKSKIFFSPDFHFFPFIYSGFALHFFLLLLCTRLPLFPFSRRTMFSFTITYVFLTLWVKKNISNSISEWLNQ